MKRKVSLILAAMMFMVFTFGCAGVEKETKLKCPKCGAVFTVDEGVKKYQENIGGGGS